MSVKTGWLSDMFSNVTFSSGDVVLFCFFKNIRSLKEELCCIPACSNITKITFIFFIDSYDVIITMNKHKMRTSVFLSCVLYENEIFLFKLL